MSRHNPVFICIRLSILVLGPALMGLSIACLFWTGLGADPTSVLADGIHMKLGLTQAWGSNVVNMLLLVLLLLADKKRVGIATVTSAVLVGPFIGFSQQLLFRFLPAPSLLPGIIAAAAASVINSLGLGIYLSAGMGASAFDGLIFCLQHKLGLSHKSALWLFYGAVFALGALLGGVWGLGTLISLVLCGPCFPFFYKRISAWTKRTIIQP